MFEITWENHEDGRNVRQSHLDSLSLSPPRLIDRGVSGGTVLSYPSSTGQISRWGKNPQRLRDRESRVRTPRTVPS